MKPKIKAPESFYGDPAYPRKGALCSKGDTSEQTARNYATTVTSPELAACRVIHGAERKSPLGENLDVPALMVQLREQAAAVNGGSLRQAEAMLMNQATALQCLFASLAERGMSCDGVVGFELNMRMALRAQSQCRATLETLAAIKNPPVVIARQANVTTGPQQVNNGVPLASHAENEIGQSKLLEADYGERMDPGTAGATCRGDLALATVAAINRPQVARG